jgi:hypothetical protein
MRVVLVNPPQSSYDLTELGPPLGLLKLGTVAGEAGAEVSIIDLNLLCHLDETLAEPSFFERATELLVAENGNLYWFTSLGIDSHIGLELARRLKTHKVKWPSHTTAARSLGTASAKYRRRCLINELPRLNLQFGKLTLRSRPNAILPLRF